MKLLSGRGLEKSHDNPWQPSLLLAILWTSRPHRVDRDLIAFNYNHFGTLGGQKQTNKQKLFVKSKSSARMKISFFVPIFPFSFNIDQYGNVQNWKMDHWQKKYSLNRNKLNPYQKKRKKNALSLTHFHLHINMQIWVQILFWQEKLTSPPHLLHSSRCFHPSPPPPRTAYPAGWRRTICTAGCSP